MALATHLAERRATVHDRRPAARSKRRRRRRKRRALKKEPVTNLTPSRGGRESGRDLSDLDDLSTTQQLLAEYGLI